MDGLLAIEFRVVPHLSREFWEQCILRFIVLRLALDFPFELEKYRQETEFQHVVGMDQGEIVASAVLIRLDEAKSQIRAVAVTPSLQGKGLGTQLMSFCESLLARQGVREVVLNARCPAVSFYRRIGYEGIGEEFEEVGIGHLKMTKSLFCD